MTHRRRHLDAKAFRTGTRKSLLAVGSFELARLRACCRFVLVLTTLLAVAAVLVAPMVDLPDTVLHAHQVAAASVSGAVTGLHSTLEAAFSLKDRSAREFLAHADSNAAAAHTSGASSLVLRC